MPPPIPPQLLSSAPDRAAVLPPGAGPQMNHRPRQGGVLKLVLLLGVIMAGCIGLGIVDYRLLLRLLPFVSFGMMGYSVYMTLKTFRRPRKVAYFGLLFAILSSATSFVVYYEIYAARDSGFRDVLNDSTVTSSERHVTPPSASWQPFRRCFFQEQIVGGELTRLWDFQGKREYLFGAGWPMRCD